MAQILRGIKHHTTHVTAIVSVADDGGSSGLLRKDLGILPLGDFRKCIIALANDESPLLNLLQYRFAGTGELQGHSFGNLFLAALSELTGGVDLALAEAQQVLSLKGRILPSTLASVTLNAEITERHSNKMVILSGQWLISKQNLGVIDRVYLEPNDAPGYPDAISAILEADLIIAGPGSLYTSILPNLLLQDIVQALRVTPALKLYVCNVATQSGETDGYSVQDHFCKLEEHVGTGIFTHVLANNNLHTPLPTTPLINYVHLSSDQCPFKLIEADVVDEEYPWRHDSAKLAQAVMNLFSERTGPLSQ